MRHLFIINPIATRVKGKVRDLRDEIESFFRARGMGDDRFKIYITDWARDGMAHAGEFALAHPDTVRIHSMGGSGTLYEIVNGTIGLPNVQIAAYPLGAVNFFLYYLGKGDLTPFRSIENQVTSNIIPIDVIHHANSYGISFALVGLEAISDREGSVMIDQTGLPNKFCFLYSAAKAILNGGICQRYRVDIDGRDYGGEYLSIMIANTQSYGGGLRPAPEALPYDGVLDIYFTKKMSALTAFRVMSAYTSGNYKKFPGQFTHTRGKRITLAAKKDIYMSVDSERFYERRASYEIIPRAVNIVCPDAVRAANLPNIGEFGEAANG